MVWALILAAGESRRMGAAKLLLPYGGATIIETVIDHVVRSKIDRVLVILGSRERKIRDKIRDLPVSITVNPLFSQGMHSSVQRGFASLPENTRACLVVLGDQPSIPSSVIDAMIDAWEQERKGIVLPVYAGQRGHPILIDMRYRDEVKTLDPGTGLRGLVHDHGTDVLEVEVDTQNILKDIDTKEDYITEMKGGKTG